jgi:Spy/CpxP family protein refolding chaperone
LRNSRARPVNWTFVPWFDTQLKRYLASLASDGNYFRESILSTKNIIMLLGLLCVAPAWSADTPASASATSPTTEQVLEQFRNDMQAAAADIMAKGLTLSSEQAAKFWPMFEAFQNEQKAIIDAQLKSLVKYRDTYQTMTDADALAYANSLLKRDTTIHDLRVKYLAKFQQVVPARIAARAIQLDRRLGLVAQVKVSSQVPLIP